MCFQNPEMPVKRCASIPALRSTRCNTLSFTVKEYVGHWSSKYFLRVASP